MTPGELIAAARARHGVTQAQLALRTGTRQSAISRLETGDISPSVQTLDTLLRAMGEQLSLGAQVAERPYDPLHRAAAAARTPAERLELAISWNRLAGRLAAAGHLSRGR